MMGPETNIINLGEYRDMRDEEKRIDRQNQLLRAARLHELEISARVRREEILRSLGMLAERGVPDGFES